jgi:multidrug efflux system membrane fusion protein
VAKHIPTGPIIAVIIVIGAVAWLYTGDNGETQAEADSQTTSEPSLMPKVQATVLNETEVRRTVIVNGVPQPLRSVSVTSEATGRVVEILKNKGDRVEVNDIIARLDPQDLEARLRQARAYVEQTRLEYEGSQRLRSEGLQNRAQAAATLTQYEQARAALETLERSLANTRIRAPFAGVLDSRAVEIGTYVRPGDDIAELYDFSTLKMVGNVPEADVGPMKVGQQASVSLLTGETMTGIISYIGTVANPATRTFRVDIRVEKSPRQIAGATATATVMLDQVTAHYISPALLNINNAGKLGVKTLTSDDIVQFSELSIIRSDTGGVWVAGIPDQTRLIVVGQGFVNTGEHVDPIMVERDDNLAEGL